MYVYKIHRAIRKSGAVWKYVLESCITDAVVSSAVSEYCIALEMW